MQEGENPLPFRFCDLYPERNRKAAACRVPVGHDEAVVQARVFQMYHGGLCRCFPSHTTKSSAGKYVVYLI
ncbi:MAG: hypothetical protein B5M56_08585 [Desulfococcus sp. 4484_241]|nr:MAG: hypothetical protein B5M56_08585 [Desulfococcus sp. 4484_241]